eukprot:TRINITY_DN6614_c0_g1_i2.p1 TRINITY_DN6614_c0_g1~~TRINITY_DN6614_c0_g1_i2.p1  ORF type:complete len:524 (+),score=59.77 TRINITY_DN6614_c0_g1_i2:3-1574(+)
MLCRRNVQGHFVSSLRRCNTSTVSVPLKKPNGYWNDNNHKRLLLDALTKDLKIEQPSDWTKVKLRDIKKNNAWSLLLQHGGSLQKTLQAVYPETDWNSIFLAGKKLPRGYWKDPTNQRQFWLQHATDRGIKSLDEWYKVSGTELKKLKGTASYILSLHGDSLAKALKVAFPEHDWILGRFLYPPKNIWHGITECRQFMEYVARSLNITHMDDWYSITRRQIVSCGGIGIISHFGSLPAVLKATFPEVQWVFGRFLIAPKGAWSDGTCKREFLDYCGEQLGINHLDEWYQFSRVDVDKLGGRELINRSGGLFNALQSSYPEHKWVDGRFSYVGRKSWDDPKKVRDFLEYIREPLGITSLDDWYRISQVELAQVGGAGLYFKFGTIGKTLKFAYPDLEWELEKFSNRDKRTRQRLLKSFLQAKFSDTLVENYYHPALNWENGGKMELDICIPEKNIAFEYQGEQHYHDFSQAFGTRNSLVQYSHRDLQKQKACLQNGMMFSVYQFLFFSSFCFYPLFIYFHFSFT